MDVPVIIDKYKFIVTQVWSYAPSYYYNARIFSGLCKRESSIFAVRKKQLNTKRVIESHSV